jgi:hypothetical protein
MKKITLSFVILSILAVSLQACSVGTSVAVPMGVDPTRVVVNTPLPKPSAANLPPTTAPSATPTNTATPAPAPVGPDSYPEGINPLTGLPVKDPASLLLPPALISISNSPVTARPQAGLSFAPLIFELTIGEGSSRYLTVFYGDYPEVEGKTDDEVEIGPIRSGRLPYEMLRKLYNGFVLMAYASVWVMPNLTFFTNINTENPDSINGARVSVSDLRQLAQEYQTQLGSPVYSGLAFDPAPPDGGKPAGRLWIPYSYVDQIFWKYDADAGVYRRWQDQENGKDFTELTDSLTGEPLGIENVVVMYTTHISHRETLIDLELMYQGRTPALLFRDGVMQEIYWTTESGDYERSTGKFRPVRFVNKDGQPVSLKPGQTWVEIVPRFSPYYETIDSEDFNLLASREEVGSGIWAVRFIHPENLNPSGEEAEETQ